MKPITKDAIEKAAKKTDGEFPLLPLRLIRDALATVISDVSLDALNHQLRERKRRPVDLDDFCRVAFVHVRSIRENGGQSPFSRIVKWCARNGHDYGTAHVGLITDILVQVEFLRLEDSKFKRNKCRSYSVPADVQKLLGFEGAN